VSSANLNLLKGAGVALNATNQWAGQIVVATHPPTGGLGIQLPGISVAPNLPVIGQLPTIGVPGVTVQVPITLPTVPTLPGGGKTTTPGGGNGGGGPTGPSTGSECVPCNLMPQVGLGGGGAVAPDAGNATQIGRGLSDLGVHVPNAAVTSTASDPGISPTTQKRVDLAANKAPSAQMPKLLAIIAIIALSLVTATYAKLFLLRRNV
jgi:hypothetical protein